MLQRIWDWIVGVFMIVVGVCIGAAIAGLIGFPLALGIEQLIGWSGKKDSWAFFGCWIFMFFLLQAAGFYDYYRRRRINIGDRFLSSSTQRHIFDLSIVRGRNCSSVRQSLGQTRRRRVACRSCGDNGGGRAGDRALCLGHLARQDWNPAINHIQFRLPAKSGLQHVGHDRRSRVNGAARIVAWLP